MDTTAAPAPPLRLQSLDILRGFVMLVMLFVNDLAGVTGTPPWMEHIEPSTSDGMTFVDIVFPAFLFVVGISIPFAIGSRLERGVPLGQVWKHILLRTFGLLVMGYFMVNGETIAKDCPIPPALWGLMTYAALALIWLVLPAPQDKEKTEGETKRSPGIGFWLRLLGIGLLIASALFYRGNDATGPFQMRQQWWGILGLIGWAYLVACTVYILCRANLPGVIGAIALLYCVAIADAVGGLSSLSWISQWVSIGSTLGSQATITVSGMALGMILAPSSSIATPKARIRWAFFYGLALYAAGILLHTAHGINGVFIYNKNAATPPWCLVSSAVTTWLWIVAYIVGDLRPQRWATLLVAPGQNALLAYILAPLFSYLIDCLISVGLPSFYYDLGNSFATGFWRSLLFAIAVLWIAGILQRRGVYLKL